MPAISVLMPMRDAASTVGEALASVCAQTFADFEVIVVDDGSRDDSGARVSAVRDPRVRLLRCEPSRGVAGALNVALSEAKAPLVARMDADDVCLPERFAAQLSLLTPDLGAVSCRVELTSDGDSVPAGMARYVAWQNRLLTPDAISAARFIESPVVHPTVLARRELFAHGYRGDGVAEDYDLFLRWLHAGVRIAKHEAVLLQWRDHSARATRTQEVYSKEAHRALKLDWLRRGPLAGGERVFFIGAGLEAKPLMRALYEGGVSIVAAADLHPGRQGNTIHGARVMDLDALLALRRDEPILVALGVPDAREQVRRDLTARGYVETRDFWCVC